LKIPDPDIQYIMSLLKAIARCRPGEIAEIGGKALLASARPLAVKIHIEIDGIEPDDFEHGRPGDIGRLIRAISDYNLVDLKAERRYPNHLSVSTDSEKLVCIAVIKHLGNPVGLAAAVSDEREISYFPTEEGVYLVSSQLGARIHSLLTPGSRNAMEIMGRRMLKELSRYGAGGVALGPVGEKGSWVTVSLRESGIVRDDIDIPSSIDINVIKSGAVFDRKSADAIWPDHGFESGIWITDLSGYTAALGFVEKKSLTKQTKSRVNELVESLSGADADYIIKSFERLKSEFKALVKSERAAAITETAVTVNHEINNPLTAILGNTQLLLMAQEDLPKETVAKLKAIEKSAVQIRETTGKLMSIVEPVKIPYASGLDMIDIESSKKKEK
jgi:hypothetical protein